MPYMYETIRDFRSLIVYQRAKELANDICKLSDRFPPSERYESTSQIRRAATSVAANIAECNSQIYPSKELTFISTAIGSLTETRYWVEFAYDQDFIPQSGVLASGCFVHRDYQDAVRIHEACQANHRRWRAVC